MHVTACLGCSKTIAVNCCSVSTCPCASTTTSGALILLIVQQFLLQMYGFGVGTAGTLVATAWTTSFLSEMAVLRYFMVLLKPLLYMFMHSFAPPLLRLDVPQRRGSQKGCW